MFHHDTLHLFLPVLHVSLLASWTYNWVMPALSQWYCSDKNTLDCQSQRIFSSISLDFLIVLATSFACFFSKRGSQYCVPFSVILQSFFPSNSGCTSASLLRWTNTSVHRTSHSWFWGKTLPLFALASGIRFWQTLIASIGSFLWLPWSPLSEMLLTDLKSQLLYFSIFVMMNQHFCSQNFSQLVLR